MPAFELPPVALVAHVPKDVDVVVVGMAESSSAPTLVGVAEDAEKTFVRQFGHGVAEVALSLGASAKPGKAVIVPGPDRVRYVVVGLGEIDVTPEQVRRAAGTGVRTALGLATESRLSVAVSFDAVEPEVVKGAAEGALLGAYAFAKLSGEAAKGGVARLFVVSSSSRAETRVAVESAGVVADAVCLARDWVNTPANLLYPETFADAAKAAVRRSRIDVEILDEKALERDGYGGILAVGGGSARKPRLVRLSYAPRGPRRTSRWWARGSRSTPAGST